MNLFKQAIRREIYLFMFMLGGLALLGQLHRGEDAALMEELTLSLMRGAANPPPTFKVQNRPAGPAQSPTTCSVEKRSFIVYPPRLPLFDSWEMPKARPGASTSLVLRAEMLEKSWLGFLQFSPDCNAGDVVSTIQRAFVLDKPKKPLWKIKNYWFFSTGPRQLMMINDGDVSPLPSEDHSNFCKLH